MAVGAVERGGIRDDSFVSQRGAAQAMDKG